MTFLSRRPMFCAMRPHALLEELAWRGLVHQHTDGLDAALRAGVVTGYCGFDPSASSLHVGSLVPVMGLVHLQRSGHRPIALVGGGTGLIGDPSGKSQERQLLSPDIVEQNAQGIRAQLQRFLDFDGPRAALMRNNADWLVQLRAVDFMRDVGKHFTVNYMLQKESVKGRMEGGISYTEFSYMLLQAYDFLELHRRDGATLQVGGSDQWGNVTAGIELIRRTTGATANGLTFPLVTTASGTKFGKTEAGAVWLDATATSVSTFATSRSSPVPTSNRWSARSPTIQSVVRLSGRLRVTSLSVYTARMVCARPRKSPHSCSVTKTHGAFRRQR
jgi:tyrosyl-tRNA synthetase